MTTETVSNTLAVEEAKDITAQAATTTKEVEGVETAQAAVETISLEEAKKLRQEAQSLRRRMHEFESKAKAEEDAKLSETERLKKQLDEAQAALKAKELAELRLKAARMAGLPEDLAVRLNGETEDELTVDALALARSIPKPQAVISATNPGVPPRLTEQAIRGMTPDEINKNWAAVGAALAK